VGGLYCLLYPQGDVIRSRGGDQSESKIPLSGRGRVEKIPTIKNNISQYYIDFKIIKTICKVI